MTLRIGMILDSGFPPDSRVESEAISLINAGFQVYLFAVTYQGAREELEINGIHVIRYPMSRFTYKLSALAYTIPAYHTLMKGQINDFLKRYKIEIIHIHDIQIARAVWNANTQKLPVVLDLHENRPEIMKSYRHVNTMIGRILIFPAVWEKFQNRYIKEADRIVVVTHLAKDEIVKNDLKHGDEVVVLPNTIHKDIFFNYPIDQAIKKRFSGTFNVLYLGDTGLRRGTDTAIRAAHLLSERIPDLCMILVGSNKEDPVLKKMVLELHLEDIVIFEGWQDVSLFPSYISASDACISPLKRNKHHDSTFANKIFQYMAMERPLIVSDCPPQAELVRNTKSGLVHESNNPTDLADKIYELYSDNQKRKIMGKNAKDAVMEQWNWEETSKDFISMYKSFESLSSDS